jgi:hypothetical protein
MVDKTTEDMTVIVRRTERMGNLESPCGRSSRDAHAACVTIVFLGLPRMRWRTSAHRESP